jgi:hypothetical protein
MAQMRPSKRARFGGAFRDAVPLPDDYSIVHAREGRFKRIGNGVLPALTERTTHHEHDTAWSTATSWTPFDDPDFALDPNGDSYNDVLSREVMEEPEQPDGQSAPKKRIRTVVSVRIVYFNDLADSYTLLYRLRKDHMWFGRICTVKPTWKKLSAGMEGGIFVGQWSVQTAWLAGQPLLMPRNIAAANVLFPIWFVNLVV